MYFVLVGTRGDFGVSLNVGLKQGESYHASASSTAASVRLAQASTELSSSRSVRRALAETRSAWCSPGGRLWARRTYQNSESLREAGQSDVRYLVQEMAGKVLGLRVMFCYGPVLFAHLPRRGRSRRIR